MMSWILTEECDSLLFSCLAAVARNTRFPIEQAEVSPGKWLRRPPCCGPCSSTTSRDMQIGLLVYSTHFGRYDILEDLWKYGWRHFWKVGEDTRRHKFRIPLLGEISIPDNRTWYTPGLVVLLAACLAYTKGHRRLAKTLTYFPQIYSTAPGYVSHLTMLHLYLNRRIRGTVTAGEERVLRRIGVHMGGNPLLHALLGNRFEAHCALRSRWPEGEITVRTWSEPWALQRSDGDSGLVRGNVSEYQANHDRAFVLHCLELFQR